MKTDLPFTAFHASVRVFLIDTSSMTRKRTLTVLQIIPKLQVGGVERGVVDVAKFLKEKGHVSLVISAGGKLLPLLKRAGVTHWELPVDSKNPLTLLLNAWRLRKIIKEYHVDIVHARSRAPAWSAYWASRRTDCTFLTTFHGTYNFKGKFKKFYNSVMTYGRKIIAPSQFIKKHIVANYSVNPKSITVIPRGVDLKTFAPGSLEPGRIKAFLDRYHLPFDRRIILMPGRITRWKGHLVVLKAMALMKRQDFCCVFLGSLHKKNQGYFDELKTFIRDHGLEGRVFVLTESDDMALFYKMSYGVLSASTDPEAFGRIMAEAGSVGCPVIASDHGGAQEIIIPGKTGWLFPNGDAGALAHCLEELLSLGIRKYKTMGEAAIEHIGNNFSNEQMLSKTLSVYQSLV